MSNSIILYKYLVKLRDVPDVTEVNNVAFTAFDEVGNLILSGEDEAVMLAIAKGNWEWVMRAD